MHDCEVDGCLSPAEWCLDATPLDGAQPHYFCREHAIERGYCPACRLNLYALTEAGVCVRCLPAVAIHTEVG